MTIKRIGHRYIDVASGKTIDTWFPRANKEIARSCLAQKVGVIKSDFVEIENRCNRSANLYRRCLSKTSPVV